MQDKARILIDVDGVIADFVDGFMYMYKLNGGAVPDGFEWNHWDSMDELPDQGVREGIWHDPDLFFNLKPYPGAIDALEKLNSVYDVRIVTSLPHRHIPHRSDWFQRYAPFIHRKDQMIFTNDKSLIMGDVLIDDSLDHIRAWNEAGHINAIIVDRPWNKTDAWDVQGTRVSGLVEVCEIFGLGVDHADG